MRVLDFKRSSGACTVVQFGRGKNVRVFCECRAESVDSAGFPTGSVQCKVYAPDVRVYRTPGTKEGFVLIIVEPMEKFGGRFVRGVRRDVSGKIERRRGQEWVSYRGNVVRYVVLCQGLQGHAPEWC